MQHKTFDNIISPCVAFLGFGSFVIVVFRSLLRLLLLLHCLCRLWDHVTRIIIELTHLIAFRHQAVWLPSYQWVRENHFQVNRAYSRTLNTMSPVHGSVSCSPPFMSHYHFRKAFTFMSLYRFDWNINQRKLCAFRAPPLPLSSPPPRPTCHPRSTQMAESWTSVRLLLRNNHQPWTEQILLERNHTYSMPDLEWDEQVHFH